MLMAPFNTGIWNIQDYFIFFLNKHHRHHNTGAGPETLMRFSVTTRLTQGEKHFKHQRLRQRQQKMWMKRLNGRYCMGSHSSGEGCLPTNELLLTVELEKYYAVRISMRIIMILCCSQPFSIRPNNLLAPQSRPIQEACTLTSWTELLSFFRTVYIQGVSKMICCTGKYDLPLCNGCLDSLKPTCRGSCIVVVLSDVANAC